MVWNLNEYSCSHRIFPSAGMFYNILQNGIGSDVPMVLAHEIDFGERSSEPS